MSLFDIKPIPPNPETHRIAALIQRKRYQILVHSYLYYECNDPLISDDAWSKWAVQLDELQKKYPDIAKTVCFAEEFKDFDPSTGYNLDYRQEQISNIAERLLRNEHKKSIQDTGRTACEKAGR
jgi:hypothetical protein